MLHRLLGCYPWKGGLRWITQADDAEHPDGPCVHSQILGRLVGGEVDPRAERVPLAHRLRALGRLGRHALRALRRRC